MTPLMRLIKFHGLNHPISYSIIKATLIRQVLCNVYNHKSTNEIFETLLSYIIPLNGVRLCENGVIMPVVTEWYLPSTTHFAVIKPKN